MAQAACSNEGSAPAPAAKDAAAAETAANPAGLDADAQAADAQAAAASLDAAVAEAAPETAPAPDAAPELPSPPDTAPAEVADTAAGADADAAANDAAADAAADVPGVSCAPGAQSCDGAKLKTCLSKGDGYAVSPCFPGTTCAQDAATGKGACVPVAHNLIIIFDTSGSMNDIVKDNKGVPKCQAGDIKTFPLCDVDENKLPGGCTRMGASKSVFKKALGKIDDALVHMALFRFPQKISKFGVGTGCPGGAYQGNGTITGDDSKQALDDDPNKWFVKGLSEILCVPFAANAVTNVKDAMLQWMNGLEDQNANPVDPELRANGSTPIGKSLFYAGEYIRNFVIVDGKPCQETKDCKNVNYVCGPNFKCIDPARSCRETVVVLFTDGGEANSNTFFGPWVQAKRLAMGLKCASDGDCAGGATCQEAKVCKKPNGTTGPCVSDAECTPGSLCKGDLMCLPKDNITGYLCSKGMTPCLPDAAPDSPSYCAGVCVIDPRPSLTASAANLPDNALHGPDGKPISVRVVVVDISGETGVSQVTGSASIAIAGSGKLLGADAGDPGALLDSVEAAFDIKTKKVCGVEK